MDRIYRRSLGAIVAILVLFTLYSPMAADVYYASPLADLKIKGDIPGWLDLHHYPYDHRFLRAVVDGDAEIYVGRIEKTQRLGVRIAKRRPITGRLVVPHPYTDEVATLKFSIDAAVGSDAGAQRRDFLKTKAAHYQLMLTRDLPGAAWFRYQLRETNRALGQKSGVADGVRRNFVWRRSNNMEDTYALFSGGRAVSENLQLDRVMPTSEVAEPTVALGSLAGVTVREFDWKRLVKDLQPDMDPLATLVPYDQHAIFFPSFAALVAVADHAADHGTPILRAAEPRAEDARTRERYERQLCLPTSALARIVGPHLIKSVAITGGDPYLRTGADIALLFEAKNVRALRMALDAQVAKNSAGYKTAKAVTGEVDGVYYSGMRSPDRAVCSFVATLGNCVVVTNSTAQLRQLVSVQQGKKESLATLDEYTFFRDRYPRGDKDESGLLILSDATIRRWCGPKWRIATSRRTRAAALMTDIQAAHLDKLVAGEVQLGPVHTKRPLADAGEMLLGPTGVRSGVYGTLAFHTPIIEQDFTRVTKREAEFYRMWRDGYQRQWSNFFDPIAIRFLVTDKDLAADLTVMPLIANSEYNQFISVSKGAEIDQRAGDPHKGTLLHGAMSLNVESPTLKMLTNFAQSAAPDLKADPLSWIGESVSIYVDDDPFWEEVAKAEDADAFMQEQGHRLPVALHVEVESAFKMTLFLTALRAFIEQTSPGNTVWEAKEHNGQGYVQVAPSEQAKSGDDMDKLRIYYAATAEGLTVTPSEDLLKRSIDRRLATRKAKKAGKPLPRTGEQWLGENLCIHLDKNLLSVIGLFSPNPYQKEMQRVAWASLPILNEWKRRYPDSDPIAVHQQWWQRRLVCPGGGEYRWNKKWQTMESTVYGHPGQPLKGDSLPTVLQQLESANLGLTFEDNGLRARVQLRQ